MARGSLNVFMGCIGQKSNAPWPAVPFFLCLLGPAKQYTNGNLDQDEQNAPQSGLNSSILRFSSGSLCRGE
jgi:hypothetical protein